MYSVVLMMAMTTGGDAADLGRHHGCSSCGHSGGCATCGYAGGCATCANGVCSSTLVASADPTTATIVVSLPADAKLSIDDQPTTSTSAQRVFVSPSLPTGKDFYYTLKAEITVDGKPTVVSQVVKVRAGEESRVTLAAATGVAER